MATWQDLERRLEMTIDTLPQKAAEALDKSASALVAQLEANTPIGEVGATPFLHDAMTTRGQVVQLGAAATVGVAPKRLLGDPSTPSPRDTIRDFLRWWSESGQGKLRRPKDKDSVGAQDFHPWWSLSREQKESLEEQRALGRFGGQPPAALYWYVQEDGNGAARVSPQRYAAKAWEAALPTVRSIMQAIRLF